MDSTAGFILTGGRSSRMGRDKALLPIEGSLLVERTAEGGHARGDRARAWALAPCWKRFLQ